MSNNPYLPDPFVKYFILADGTKINGDIGETRENGDLWIWPEDTMTFMDAVLLFSDPSKTSAIDMHYSEYETAMYIGYTKLDVIKEESPGKIAIRMNKQVN